MPHPTAGSSSESSTRSTPGSRLQRRSETVSSRRLNISRSTGLAPVTTAASPPLATIRRPADKPPLPRSAPGSRAHSWHRRSSESPEAGGRLPPPPLPIRRRRRMWPRGRLLERGSRSGVFVSPVGLPVRQAGLGVLSRRVTPAIGPTLPVGGSHELGELLREDTPSLVDPLLGQAVVWGIPDEIALLDQPVQVPDADVCVDSQEALNEGSIGIVAESLPTQPEHHLQDLIAPVEGAEGLRFWLGRCHGSLCRCHGSIP